MQRAAATKLGPHGLWRSPVRCFSSSTPQLLPQIGAMRGGGSGIVRPPVELLADVITEVCSRALGN